MNLPSSQNLGSLIRRSEFPSTLKKRNHKDVEYYCLAALDAKITQRADGVWNAYKIFLGSQYVAPDDPDFVAKTFDLYYLRFGGPKRDLQGVGS